jgi:hypothetical protein
MAMLSIRQRLLSMFGMQRRQTVIPRTRQQAYYRAYQGGTESSLIDAIERRQPVTFYYDDKWQPEGTPGKIGQRVGNPHAVWIGPNGTKYLHLYVDPQSASATGELPGWRTFILSRIKNVSVLELGSALFGRPVRFVLAPGWNPAWYSQVGQPIKLIQR